MDVSAVADLDELEETAGSVMADEIEAETALTGPDTELADTEWSEPIEIPQPLEVTEGRGDGETETSHMGSRARHRDTRTGGSEVEQDEPVLAEATASEALNAYDYPAEELEDVSEDLSREGSPVDGEEEPTYGDTLTSSPEEANEIMVVGGARPAIEEPTTEDAEGNVEETGSELPVAAEAAAPEEIADDEKRPTPEDDTKVVVVGEAHPTLPADGRDDATREASGSLHVAALEHGAAYASGEAESDRPEAEVERRDDALVLPVDSPEPQASALHPSSDHPEHLQKTRRTEVIQVGEHDEREEGGPRRGWWQRLLS